MRNTSSPIPYSEALFVARQPEVKVVSEAIDNLQKGISTKRTIMFTGERGIGKSWLLEHLQTHVLPGKSRVRVFKFDLDTYAKEDPPVAVAKILKEFRKEILKETGNFGVSLAEMNRTVIEELHRRGGDHILVVLADSVYESSWDLLTVLEDYFLGSLAIEPRTVIVMAGRGRAYPWRTPELGTQADIRPLPPFDEHQTREQLEQLRAKKAVPQETSLDTQRIERLWQYSGGNPLVNRHLAIGPDLKGALNTAIDDMLSIVETDDRNEVRGYLEALSVLRSFKEDRIPAMLTAYDPEGDYSEWRYAESRAVREVLTRNAFAYWDEGQNGYVISDSPRKQIEAYLKLARPGVWIDLHCMAYTLYTLWADKYDRAKAQWQGQADYHVQQLAADGHTPGACGRMQAKLDALMRNRP